MSTAPNTAQPLVQLENLRMHFPVRGGIFLRQTAMLRAVDDVSLTIHKGETLGLVGESGCGKSTLGKCLVRLNDPTGGRVIFDGTDITEARSRQLRPFRRRMQMIFQDPAESLNSRMSIREIIMEPFAVQGMGTPASRKQWADELLARVGMSSQAGDRFPFEFSGGQRQRIGIARSIALNPEFVVCDEPVSALDVSVQSQVINLLLELQRELGLTYLFIAHDLAVVKHVSDRVAVMYLGKIVEIAPSDEIYRNPRHAYTKALLEAIPRVDPTRRGGKRHLLEGDVPSPVNPPAGCAFGHRMGHPKWKESTTMDLRLKEITPGHWVQPCPCCVE